MSGTQGAATLRLLTINTHKGFTTFNRRFILPELREAVRLVNADVVCLQEVMGAHEAHSAKIEHWPATGHYEFIADAIWHQWAYGRNAVYPEGHHGNAVLSRYPIANHHNRDISIEGHEKRGLLDCTLTLPHHTVHVICVHLGLKEVHRQAQLEMLSALVNSYPREDPVVVAGDFNDWRGKANKILSHRCGLEEVFTRAWGRPARTFPVEFPLLRLDRVYVKNATASVPAVLPLRNWRHLSDHAPLAVELTL